MAIHLPMFQPKVPVGGLIKNGILVPVLDAKGVQRLDRWNKPLFRPKQVDEWIIMTPIKGPDGLYVVDKKAMEALPKDSDGKCRRLPVFFSSDDIEEAARTYLAGYIGPVRACVGDGKVATRWEIKAGVKTGNKQERKCPCEWLTEPEEGGPECSGTLDLRCSIDLKDAVTLGSVHRYQTHGVIGITELVGSLIHIQRVIGSIVAVPMWLCLKPVVVNPRGAGRKTVYTAYLEIRGNNIEGLQKTALARASAVREVAKVAGLPLQFSLPSPEEESEDDEADAAREFHPDVIDTTVSDRGEGSKQSAPQGAPQGTPQGTPQGASQNTPLQEQTPTPEQMTQIKVRMGKLSSLLNEPTSDKEERSRRMSQMAKRILFGLGYKFHSLNMSEYVEVAEILEKHILIEEGIIRLDALFGMEDKSKARDFLLKRIGIKDPNQIDPSSLDDILENIQDAIAFSEQIETPEEKISDRVDESSDSGDDDDGSDDGGSDDDGSDDDGSDGDGSDGDGSDDDHSDPVRDTTPEIFRDPDTEKVENPPDPTSAVEEEAKARPPGLSEDPDRVLGKNDPLRTRLERSIERLAKLRGIDGSVKERKELLAIVSQGEIGRSVTMTQITSSMAMKLIPAFEQLVQAREQGELG